MFDTGFMKSPEVWLLVVQMVLLYRILRDLSAIDLDQLLAAIRVAPAPSPAASARVCDEPLTKEQRELFVELNSGGQSCGFDGDDLLRVLFSCDFNRQQAEQKLVSNRVWYDKLKPKQVTPAHLSHSLPSGTCRLGGFSRCGWPIVECYLEHWRPWDYDNEEQHRLVAFAFEHALQRMPPGQDRLAVLADMSGWRLRHSLPHPFSLVLSIVQLAQGPYVERLGVALFVNTPPIFRATWRLLQPLLSERVTSRVMLLGTDWREHVAGQIDEDNLPKKLGGKRPLAGPPHFGFL